MLWGSTGYGVVFALTHVILVVLFVIACYLRLSTRSNMGRDIYLLKRGGLLRLEVGLAPVN